MSSEVEISNLAISHLAIAKEINDFETEKSAEAKACLRFYETARDETLRDYTWPFASRIVTLAPVAGVTNARPNVNWLYSYRYPADCIRASRILSGLRVDTEASRIPFQVSSDDSGLLIFSDQPEPELEYTARIANTAFYPPDFVVAFSHRLAAFIAPRLAGGSSEGTRLQQLQLQLYQLAILKAQTGATQEEVQDQAPDSEFIRARI